MRELVLTCSLALLGSGCVEVASHRDDFDAGPDIVVRDTTAEPEASLGQCTSGERWTGGNSNPSGDHFPGRACMASNCHDSKAKVPFTIAGTVYPLKGNSTENHDDDDCNGLDNRQTPAAVGVTDDGGMRLFPLLPINAVGNFYTTKSVPGSFHVTVASGGRDAVQKSPVMDGNCNTCHSKDGIAGANGRIVPEPP